MYVDILPRATSPLLTTGLVSYRDDSSLTTPEHQRHIITMPYVQLSPDQDKMRKTALLYSNWVKGFRLIQRHKRESGLSSATKETVAVGSCWGDLSQLEDFNPLRMALELPANSNFKAILYDSHFCEKPILDQVAKERKQYQQPARLTTRRD